VTAKPSKCNSINATTGCKGKPDIQNWVSCGRLYLDTFPEDVSKCNDLHGRASKISWPPWLELDAGALVLLAGGAVSLLSRVAQLGLALQWCSGCCVT